MYFFLKKNIFLPELKSRFYETTIYNLKPLAASGKGS
jgi:hypothetical protein